MDVFRAVTISGANRPVVQKNLENGSTYTFVRDSMVITPPVKKQQVSQSGRRYGGGWIVGESHENGKLDATLLVSGGTADEVAANVEALLAEIETIPSERFIEWKAEGATYPVFFEIRGSGTYEPHYKWSEWNGALVMEVAVSWPVAPLVRGHSMESYDDFSVDSIADYTFLAGSGTLTVSGGKLVPSSVANKRFHNTARGYSYGDVQVTLGLLTGALAGGAVIYDTRLILKYIDENNYLYARALDDGTTRQIQLWKRDAGTDTSLVAAVAITALTANTTTPYRLRFRIEGNVVTGEWFLPALNDPSPVAAPDNTITYTLAGADATKFGAGITGKVQVSVIPGDTNTSYDSLHVAPYWYRNRTLPEKIALGGPIPGDAPALGAVSITKAAAEPGLPWALIAWGARKTPASGEQNPFGLIEAESTELSSSWASAADGGARGGNLAVDTTASSAETYRLEWKLSSDAIVDDDETPGQMVLEVWARVKLSNTLVTPRLAAALHFINATDTAAIRYTEEFGSTGKLLTLPVATNTVYRMVRLGTLVVPRNPAPRREPWYLRINGTLGSGSSGTFGIDYLTLIPAKRRAASPTAKPDGTTYPKLFLSSGDQTKQIRSDLSGAVTILNAGALAHTGLGGSQIELAPGSNDLLVKLSNLVPDDPTVDAAAETLTHVATVALNVIPRWHLMR